MYPELNNPNEVCLYYYAAGDSWHNGTDMSTANTCNHNQGYHDIMGHTHPRRITAHPVEVNYYPSSQDIFFPIVNSQTQKNYILTPIGLFIAKYELTSGYKFNIDQQEYDHYAKYINDLFFPIHTLTLNMEKDLSLDKISKQVTPNLITYVDDICNAVTAYVNSYVLQQLPKLYELSYIDIHQIEKLVGGRAMKTRRRRNKKRKLSTRKSTRKLTRKSTRKSIRKSTRTN